MVDSINQQIFMTFMTQNVEKYDGGHCYALK